MSSEITLYSSLNMSLFQQFTLTQDPLQDYSTRTSNTQSFSHLVTIQCPLDNSQLLPLEALRHFLVAGHPARVALADLVARGISLQAPFISSLTFYKDEPCSCHIAPLHYIHKRLVRKALLPFILQRTDIWCNTSHLFIQVRVTFSFSNTTRDETYQTIVQRDSSVLNLVIQPALNHFLQTIFTWVQPRILSHIAHVLLQSYIRDTALPTWDFSSSIVTAPQEQSTRGVIGAVAFLANGSILPRKSGMSQQPMSPHKAVPLKAPTSENLNKTLRIDIGFWNDYIRDEKVEKQYQDEKLVLVIQGMIIPKGVCLICGGGFHGKSTLLRTISMGVYDKVYGDGRELCVTVYDAVNVRAEDGRYVSHVNISAFMSSNSFFLQEKTTSLDIHDDPTLQNEQHHIAFPTHHMFSTKEASGSTSQASNVMEAIEFGASALLLDEDICAANFMARDGRMRALVKDETITPLLYRVNGLYRSRGISSVIVIGGVGDWLDVPDHVILIDKHHGVQDALQRARSISHQFSYGHIQYGGRGVVHRLEWRKYDEPKNEAVVPGSKDDKISWLMVDDINPRERYICNAYRFDGGKLVLLDGESKFAILVDHVENAHNMDELSSHAISGTYYKSDEDDEDEDDLGAVDLSKCEQIAGNIWQVLGCALALQWIIHYSTHNKTTAIKALVDSFDLAMDSDPGDSFPYLIDHAILLYAGYALRPRKFEIALAVARLRGCILLPVPFSKLEVDELVRKKEEQSIKSQALADLWSQRR